MGELENERGEGGEARARDTKGGGGGAERERIGERQTDRTGERVGVERDGVRGRGGGEGGTGRQALAYIALAW